MFRMIMPAFYALFAVYGIGGIRSGIKMSEMDFSVEGDFLCPGF